MASIKMQSVERTYLPDTISPQARAILGQMLSQATDPAFSVQPKTPEDWAAVKAKMDEFVTEWTKPVIAEIQHAVDELHLGNIPAIRVRKGNEGRAVPILIYVHGGGFTMLSARQYQAIQTGGGTAILDLYEGMPHVFQSVLAGSPESDAAYKRATAFWDSTLRK